MTHTIKANGYKVELEKGGSYGPFFTQGWIAYYIGPDGVRHVFQTYGQLAYAKEAAPKAAVKIHAMFNPVPVAPPEPATTTATPDDLFAILFGEEAR